MVEVVVEASGNFEQPTAANVSDNTTAVTANVSDVMSVATTGVSDVINALTENVSYDTRAVTATVSDVISVATTNVYDAKTAVTETINVTKPYVFVKTWKFWLPQALPTGLYFVIAVWITVALVRDYCIIDRKNLPKMKRWIKLVSIFCTVVSAFAFLSDYFEEIVVDHFAHELCTATMYAKVAIGRSAFSLSYLVFWLRQRSIYTSPELRDFTSSFLRFISWVALSVSLAFPFVIFGLRAGGSRFAVGSRGCGVVSSAIPSGISWYMSSVASVLTQSCLLYPFLKPLMKHASDMKGGGVTVKPLILRSLICASVCAATDIVAFTICAIDLIRNGFIIGTAVQGSIVINMIMVVVAFPNWKKTVLPCYRERENIDAKVTVVRIPSIASEVQDTKSTRGSKTSHYGNEYDPEK